MITAAPTNPCFTAVRWRWYRASTNRFQSPYMSRCASRSVHPRAPPRRSSGYLIRFQRRMRRWVAARSSTFSCVQGVITSSPCAAITSRRRVSQCGESTRSLFRNASSSPRATASPWFWQWQYA